MKKLSIPALLLPLLFATAARANYVFPAFPNLPSFDSPMGLEDPLDGTDRLFVMERAGAIYEFQNDPAVATRSLFLDIGDSITTQTEGGLLGLAFHPNYENNRFFYVTYTIENPRREVLSRFTASATNPNVAVPGTELRILEIPKVNLHHNGGRIVFGPGGYLYWSLGEDGIAHYSQDLTKFNGKLLRIDVDNPSGGKNYGIPPGNPFVGGPAGALGEIWAYGFRNPWRFSFDVPAGRLWLGDVGENSWEEVNIILKGRNYGWPRMEGNDCFSPSTCDTTGLHIVAPLFVYDHNGGGGAITGGFVYRGSSMPSLVGKYVYADFITGEMGSLSWNGVNPPVHANLPSVDNISAFGVDRNNELYLCSFDGNIYRLFMSTTSVSTPAPAPGSLGVVHPNPFQSSATIEFSLAVRSRVTLEIFDVAGRRVAMLMDETAGAGAHTATWNGRDANGSPQPSGVYFCRLMVGSEPADARRIILLK